MEKNEKGDDLKFTPNNRLSPVLRRKGKRKIRKILSHVSKGWTLLTIGLCVVFVTLYLFMEITESNRIDDQFTDVRSEIKRVDLKATASLKASEDINYFANIILTLDELTKGSIPDIEISEIAFMIYGVDRELSHLCGFTASVALAMIEAESAGDPKAISPIIEAKGLWQLHDTTGKRVFTAVGYGIGNYYREVFNPLKNSRGALYHIRKELYPYWSEKAPNKNLCLAYIIHSYRWGVKATERLRTSWKRDRMPGMAYTEKILKRSIYFKKKLKGEPK